MSSHSAAIKGSFRKQKRICCTIWKSESQNQIHANEANRVPSDLGELSRKCVAGHAKTPVRKSLVRLENGG
jgi:hypothetical protein